MSFLGDEEDVFQWLINENEQVVPTYDYPETVDPLVPETGHVGALPSLDFNSNTDELYPEAPNDAEYHVIHPNLTWAGQLHGHDNMQNNFDEQVVYEPPMQLEPPLDYEDDVGSVSGDVKEEEVAEGGKFAFYDELLAPALPEETVPTTEPPAEEKTEKPTPTRRYRRRKRAHMTEEERKEFLKRRNREAVRMCRKRKRDLYNNLKSREATLMRDNQRMRLQLRLGTPDFTKEVRTASEEIVRGMQEEIAAPPGENRTANLRRLSIMYMALYCDISANPDLKLSREAVPLKLLEQVYKLSYPTNYNKMYLWQNIQQESYFNVDAKGMWKDLSRYLEFTEEQMYKLKQRRSVVAEICKSVASTLMAVKRLEATLESKFKNPTDAAALKLLSSILNPIQFSKLVITLHHGEVFQDLRENLDKTWDKYLRSYDKEIDEQVKSGRYRFNQDGLKSLEAPFYQQGSEEEEALKRLRHSTTSTIMKQLFEGPISDIKEHVEALSIEGELFDPNFKQAIKGTEDIIRYIRYFRNAFKDLSASEEGFSSRQNKNVARSRWQLSGVYNGKLPVETGNAKRVSFKVLIAYKFIPKSSKVKQLVVSWAAFSLMKQLGIFKVNKELLKSLLYKHKTTSTSKSSSAKCSTPPVNPEVVELRKRRCIEFGSIFSDNDGAKRCEIAKSFLAENCVWVDSNFGGKFEGRELCINYVERLRKRMPQLYVTKHRVMSADESSLKFHMSCLVKGQYKGALSVASKNFVFSAQCTFTFEPNNKLVECILTWNAGELMGQLAGVS